MAWIHARSSQRVRGQPANRTLACISRTRHARSLQRVTRATAKSHSRLHFAHSTHTISAEGCAGTRQIALSRLHFAHSNSNRAISAEGYARTGQIALSPAFGVLDANDFRRGLHFWLTLFVPPSAFKREFVKWGNVFFIRTSPVLVFQYLHLSFHCMFVCILIVFLRTH